MGTLSKIVTALTFTLPMGLSILTSTAAQSDITGYASENGWDLPSGGIDRFGFSYDGPVDRRTAAGGAFDPRYIVPSNGEGFTINGPRIGLGYCDPYDCYDYGNGLAIYGPAPVRLPNGGRAFGFPRPDARMGYFPVQGSHQAIHGLAPGVECIVAGQQLTAANVDSCEAAGGRVRPVPENFTIPCEVDETTVMTSSTAACAKLGGALLSK